MIGDTASAVMLLTHLILAPEGPTVCFSLPLVLSIRSRGLLTGSTQFPC